MATRKFNTPTRNDLYDDGACALSKADAVLALSINELEEDAAAQGGNAVAALYVVKDLLAEAAAKFEQSHGFNAPRSVQDREAANG